MTAQPAPRYIIGASNPENIRRRLAAGVESGSHSATLREKLARDGVSDDAFERGLAEFAPGCALTFWSDAWLAFSKFRDLAGLDLRVIQIDKTGSGFALRANTLEGCLLPDAVNDGRRPLTLSLIGLVEYAHRLGFDLIPLGEGDALFADTEALAMRVSDSVFERRRHLKLAPRNRWAHFLASSVWSAPPSSLPPQPEIEAAQ